MRRKQLLGQQTETKLARHATLETRGPRLPPPESFFTLVFYFKSVNKSERRVNMRIQDLLGRRREHQSHFHAVNLSFLIPPFRFSWSSVGALMFQDTLCSLL